MKDYQAGNIRNIAVVGHGSEGKTTLVEALLFAAGGVLFIISDNILCAYSFGSERRFGANIGIHATYYAAQLLIAWSVFFM